MSSCPKCQTRFSGGARLCRNCGTDLSAVADGDEGRALDDRAPRATPRVPFVPPSVGIRTCPRCGRIVPATVLTCAECSGASAPIVVPPRADGAYWARVRCEYHCAGCKSWVPLASFGSSGDSTCVLCNHPQAQPLFFWRVVLKHAHAVADLAGPDPEGRAPTPGVSIATKNPYKELGVDAAEIAGDAMREDDDVPRALFAGPGHPPCDECLTPLEGDATALACPRCKRPARTVLPKLAATVNRALRAIVVTGGAASVTPGVVALRCPTCSGALTLAEGATQATCRFCQTTSLVNRAAPSAPLPLATFFLFAGPSAKRTELSKV